MTTMTDQATTTGAPAARPVCIVGGSGFIGTSFARHLFQAGQAFTLFDKVPSHAFAQQRAAGDIRNLEDLRRFIPAGSVIVHLAAEHRDDVRPKSLYDDVNVTGTRHICMVAEEKGIDTIIFTSSVAVYGFAQPGTDETGAINYFNDYGRTKWEAEQLLRDWHAKDPAGRTLVIIRPTVVFGERNRGNVYNLLNQIARGPFLMIGRGKNRKSMAYVENVAAFLEHALGFGRGYHLYNYVDKPDMDMNALIQTVQNALGRGDKKVWRIPYWFGLYIGGTFDLLALLTRKRFPVSRIRVQKFCATTAFETGIAQTGFVPPYDLATALSQTIHHEFIDPPDERGAPLYYSE